MEKLWGTILCNYCERVISGHYPRIVVTKLDKEEKKLHYCNDSCRINHGDNKNIKQINYRIEQYD